MKSYDRTCIVGMVYSPHPFTHGNTHPSWVGRRLFFFDFLFWCGGDSCRHGMSIHFPLHARLGCESPSWDSWRIFLSVFFLCVGIRDGIMFAWRGEGRGGIIYIRGFMVERGWFWRVGDDVLLFWSLGFVLWSRVVGRHDFEDRVVRRFRLLFRLFLSVCVCDYYSFCVWSIIAVQSPILLRLS